MGKLIEGRFPSPPDDQQAFTKKDRCGAVREKDEFLRLFEIKSAIDRIKAIAEPLIASGVSPLSLSPMKLEGYREEIKKDERAAVKRICKILLAATEEGVRRQPEEHLAMATAIDEYFNRGPRLLAEEDQPETE